MPGKGSVTRSVRIEKDADERLRQLATQGDTSVNTLVNRALRKFVEWDAYGEKFGFITMPAVILVKLMDCLTDEEASALGAWAGKNFVQSEPSHTCRNFAGSKVWLLGPFRLSATSSATVLTATTPFSRTSNGVFSETHSWLNKIPDTAKRSYDSR